MHHSQQYLGKTVSVKIDRALGSKHHKYGFIYPINYGFIEGTKAPDKSELDAYVLGIFEPVESFNGKCIAIIHRTNDEDDKLVVVPNGKKYSEKQIRALTEFQERFFKSRIITFKAVKKDN